MLKIKIPLVDLKAQHDSIKEELFVAINTIVANSAFIMGKPVKNFEENWARYCAAKHAVACANGTVAVELALRAAGIGPGDEVITVPNTFIATTESITNVGATIKFIDVEEKTMLIDANKLEAAIGPKTKAVIAVHLYGQMCEMDRLREICDKHGLKLIEDAAQAHGAEYKGKPVGHYGDAATYSFFPAKVLGCLGDGGAVTTNNEKTAEMLRLLVNHGRLSKYEHLREAHNYRLDALQAAILDVKLPHLDTWIGKRREHAKAYDASLPRDILAAQEIEGRKHVYYMYEIRTPLRDKLLDHLEENEISCGIHYPLPLHLQPAYKHLGHKKGDFPVAEKAADEILSIPLYPELTEQQREHIIKIIKQFFST